MDRKQFNRPLLGRVWEFYPGVEAFAIVERITSSSVSEARIREAFFSNEELHSLIIEVMGRGFPSSSSSRDPRFQASSSSHGFQDPFADFRRHQLRNQEMARAQVCRSWLKKKVQELYPRIADPVFDHIKSTCSDIQIREFLFLSDQDIRSRIDSMMKFTGSSQQPRSPGRDFTTPSSLNREFQPSSSSNRIHPPVAPVGPIGHFPSSQFQQVPSQQLECYFPSPYSYYNPHEIQAPFAALTGDFWSASLPGSIVYEQPMSVQGDGMAWNYPNAASHPPTGPRSQPCKYYFSSMGCYKSVNCPFSHTDQENH